MSVPAFLSELRRLDIRVWVDGDALRCDARAGALTEELREQLRERKSDIVSFLRMAGEVAAQPSAIVPLQKHGCGAPVFGIPGHNGDVFCFRALAQALGEERPFFGLQVPGLDGRSEPLTRVEDMAAYFAEQIRALRPRGPLILAGYCMGGAVAFELAQRLLAGRESGGFVALFGAPHPAFFHSLGYRGERTAWHARERCRIAWRRARLLAAQSGRERLEYLKWRWRGPEPDPVLLRRGKVEAAFLAALRAYEPRPLAARVHHFAPSEAWAARSDVQAKRWRSVAAITETCAGPDGCTVHDMLLAQYAPVFAEHFRQSCARAGV